MATIEERIASFNPEDPDALEALEKDFLGGTLEGIDQEPKQELPEATKEEPKKEEPAKPDEKQLGEPSAAPEKVVMTRDGKHAIPYAVLEQTRERAARLEAENRTLEAQLKELRSGAKPAEVATPPMLTEEELAEAEAQSPELTKAIKSQMTIVKNLQDEIARIRQEEIAAIKNEHAVAKATREQSVMDETVAAIHANADLKAWREMAVRKESPDPMRWERAVAFDTMLSADPEWAEKPIAERFSKAVEMVKNLYGDTPQKVPDSAELKRIADAKLKDQPAKVPTTLSDIPGGVPPAQSDMENLENVSVHQLTNMFMTMTEEQQEALLSRLA